jgi:hypothetical protein
MIDPDGAIAFIEARLSDDEAYARTAFADHNNAEADWDELWSGCVSLGPDEDVLITNDSGVSRHIARHDPARVLREVEAKRVLLRKYLAAEVDDDPGTIDVPSLVLLALAAVWSDHPEYDPSWVSPGAPAQS